jgi:hypothetical protein
MSFLRSAGREVAGAWRSLRYDMRPRPGRADSPADGYPDVTSAGLSTFGGVADAGEYGRRPRRLVAASAFVLLALAGAAGSYLALVNGLGAIAADQVARAPEPLPLVAEPAALPTRPPAATRAPVRRTAPAAAPTTAVTRERAECEAAPRIMRPPAPTSRPVVSPVPTPCGCFHPPVPTPTSPSSAGPTSASPTPDPSESASATPSQTPPDPRESIGY